MPIAAFIILGLSGALINTANSDVPLNSFDAVKDAVEQEIDEVKARDGFVSFKLND